MIPDPPLSGLDEDAVQHQSASWCGPQGVARRFRELFSSNRYRELTANLESYRVRYEAILASADEPPETYRAYRRMPDQEQRDFRDFRVRYLAYVERQLARTIEALGQVDAFERGPEP